VIDFVQKILMLAGIEDKVTFTRSKIVNVSDEIQNLVTASGYLDGEYITKRILTLLGDADKVDEVIKRMEAESAKKFAALMEAQNQTEENEDDNE